VTRARIGVVGAGVMGADHVRTLVADVPAAAVVAVADISRRRAREAAPPGARALGDPHALIASPDVDAVLVAAADETHEALVLACLAAGKPVLCEKPLATTAAAALRVVEAERAGARRLVQVGFMRRYDAGYRDLARRLAAGEVGAVRGLRCAHRNAGAPPGVSSELLLTSSLPHEIDAARWLTGEEIAAVEVDAARGDPLLVTLRTAGGVTVEVELLAHGSGYDIRCEVVGASGTLALPVDVAAGFRERFAGAYRAELRAWVDGVLAGVPEGPTAWDGYAANAVADAAVEALRSGRPATVQTAARGLP
jgi:myo-inositol 2-dehydrogenase/D-chiro-inositol 1-dehydrogenase